MAPWWNRRRDSTGRRPFEPDDADVTPVEPETSADASADSSAIERSTPPDPGPAPPTDPTTSALVDVRRADDDTADIGDAIAALQRIAERTTFAADDPLAVLLDDLADELTETSDPATAEADADPADVLHSVDGPTDIEPPVEAEHVHVLTPWPPRPVGLHRPRRSTDDGDHQPGDSHVLAESWPTYPWNEPELQPQTLRKEPTTMSALSKAITDLLAIEGATGAAIVDYESGMALASGGDPGFNLDVAAAGNSNVVRAKLSTMNEIGLKDQINDILITLGTQYHLVNVLADDDQRGLFIYLVLNKANANLALARHKLSTIARAVTV